MITHPLSQAGAALVELAVVVALLAISLGSFVGIHKILLEEDSKAQFETAFEAIPNPDALEFEYNGKLRVKNKEPLSSIMGNFFDALKVMGEDIAGPGTKACAYAYRVEAEADGSGCQIKTSIYTSGLGDCGPCQASHFEDEVKAAVDTSCVSPQFFVVGILRSNEDSIYCRERDITYYIRQVGENH